MTEKVKSDIVIIFMKAFFFLLFFLLIMPVAYAGEPSSQKPQPIGQSALERGIQLLNEKQLDEALKAFEEAMSLNPKDPFPHYYSGVIYHQKRQPVPALSALNNALKLEPGMPLALLRIGMILEDIGRFDQAGEAYRAVAERKGDDPLIQEARDRLQRLTVTGHYRKAGRFFQEKRYEESLKELEAVFSLSPDHADAHFAAGMALQRLGRLKEAIESFKKVTELNPTNIDAFLQLGMTLEVFAAYDEANEAFTKVIALSPDSAKAAEARKKIEDMEKKKGVRKLFETVANLIRQEKWDDALRESNNILDIEPRNPNAFYNKGLILYKLQEIEPAIEAIRQAVEIDGKFQKGYYQLGVMYDDGGRYSEALTAYEQALSIDSKTEEGEKSKGRIDVLRPILDALTMSKEAKELLERKDIPGAIREIEAIVSIRKDDPNLYMILVSLYLQAARIKDAASSLEKAVSLSPKDVSKRSLLARLYEGLKEYGKAAEAYQAVAALSEGTPQEEEARAKAKEMTVKHHFTQAKYFMGKGDFESALSEIQAVLEISPEDPVALFNLGVVYDRLSRSEEAVAPLRRAVALSPDYVTAYLQLGMILEKLRKFSEAREAFEKVIGIQKEGKEARIAQAEIKDLKEVETLTGYFDQGIQLMEKEDWEGARKEIEAALNINPKNYVGHYYRGIILDRLGITDEAKEAFRKVIEINPKFPRAYLLLASVLITEGEYEEARGVYNDLINLGEDIPEREQAEAGLRGLRALRGSFSLDHGFNSNISYGAKASWSFQSGYNLNLDYVFLRQKRWNLHVVLSANEDVYYQSQNEGNGYSLSLNGQGVFSAGHSVTGSLSHSKSFFEGVPSSATNRLIGEAKSEPRTIPTSVSLRYELSRTKSYQSKASDSERHNLRAAFSQKLSLRDNVSGSYAFSVQKNLDVLGSNYANRTHAISLGYSRPLMTDVSYNLGYTVSFVHYSNPDSTTFFQEFRRNVSQSANTGLNIRLSESVSFSLGYSYVINTTNLPRPTAEELQKLEDILAAPIPLVGGGYRQNSVTMSASVSF